MSVTCVAAFHPKVWTYATTPRKTMFSELDLLTGLPVPAPPFAQRIIMLPDRSPRAKFCVNCRGAFGLIAQRLDENAGITFERRWSRPPASPLGTKMRKPLRTVRVPFALL